MARSKINHDVRCADGAVLFLPPSPAEGLVSLKQPDVFAESVSALYPIGTLAWYPGIGKKFRYAKAGGALTGTKILVCNANYTTGASTTNLNGFYGHCQADGVANAYDIGATELSFTDTINRVKDYYEGAYLLHFDAARNVCYEESYIISGPTAATTTPWQNTKVTLHKAKKYAVVASDGIEIFLNPYSNIQMSPTDTGYEDHVTYMGSPLIPIQSAYYFWLQTAGPIFITPNGWSTLLPGYAVNSRVCMTIGGILTTQAAQGTGHQPIGTLLCRTSDTHGAAYLNMDLDLGG